MSPDQYAHHGALCHALGANGPMAYRKIKELFNGDVDITIDAIDSLLHKTHIVRVTARVSKGEQHTQYHLTNLGRRQL